MNALSITIIAVPILHPNESLPQDLLVAEGTTADFICIGRVSQQGDVSFILAVLVQTPEHYPNFTECFRTFFAQEHEELNEFANRRTNESCTGVEILNSTSGQAGDFTHSLTVRWPSPTPSLSGAKVACALASRSFTHTYTQWVKTATLTVFPTTPSPSVVLTVTPMVAEEDRHELAAVSLLALLLLVVIGGIVLLGVLLRQRYKLLSSTTENIADSEQNANLIRTHSLQSSQSTIVYSTTNVSVPSISVHPISLPPPYSELLQAAEGTTHSHDSGLDVLGDSEGTKVHRGENLRAKPTDNLFLPATSEVSVYVSYSDSQGDWVRDTLLPLLDSFQPISVTDHEGHMIPGRVYSEERLRLLRSADKVVAVISPDYQSSEWCSYELQHVIQQSPGGAGHLIPILCDGCHSLPSTIATIHPLSLDDPHWKQKLKIAIRRQHRLST